MAVSQTTGTTSTPAATGTTAGSGATTGTTAATTGTQSAAQISLQQPISSTDPQGPNAEGITVTFPPGDALPTVQFSAASAGQGAAGSQEAADPAQSQTIIRGDDNDFLDGGVGFDVIAPGNGNNVGLGRAGNDVLLGGNGQDIFGGGTGDDLLTGADGSDFLFGGINDDVLFGQNGDDALWGNAGSDRLLGFDGDDVLIGGAGNDRSFGGNGADLYVFDSGSGTDVILGWEDGIDRIVLRQNLNGTATASGNDMASRVSANAEGSAVIDLGAGNSVVLQGVPVAQVNAADFIVVA